MHMDGQISYLIQYCLFRRTQARTTQPVERRKRRDSDEGYEFPGDEDIYTSLKIPPKKKKRHENYWLSQKNQDGKLQDLDAKSKNEVQAKDISSADRNKDKQDQEPESNAHDNQTSKNETEFVSHIDVNMVHRKSVTTAGYEDIDDKTGGNYDEIDDKLEDDDNEDFQYIEDFTGN